MTKHIAIIGSPGSGKSVFSAALAKRLGKEGKTILVSGDAVVPMLPFFCGNSDVQGLGELLSGEIDPKKTAMSVKLLPQDPQVGVMGFQLGGRYEKTEVQKWGLLGHQLDSLVDAVIWDCTSDLNAAFSSFAMDKADVVVCILTADRKGVLYYENQRELLRDKNCIYLAGMAKPYTPLEEMSGRIGGFHGILPFAKDIEVVAMEGKVFSVEKVCHSKYSEAVEIVAEILRRKGEEKNEGE